MTATALLRESLLDAAAVLLPVACSGCGSPDRSLCRACRAELRPRVVAAEAAGIPVWAALEYDGVARRVILAYKDRGRVDAAPVLAAALRAAVAVAQRASSTSPGGAPARRPPVTAALLPVLVPSSRAASRRRGYHPTGHLLARANTLVPPLWGALRLVRQPEDQAGLSAVQRAGNRSEAMIASRRLAGRRCLIVDDIVTSGATVAEAARAIRAAGGSVAGAAALSRTPLRYSASPRRSHSDP